MDVPADVWSGSTLVRFSWQEYDSCPGGKSVEEAALKLFTRRAVVAAVVYMLVQAPANEARLSVSNATIVGDPSVTISVCQVLGT